MDSHGKLVQSFKTSKAGQLKLIRTDAGYQTVRKETETGYEDQMITVFENGEIINTVSFEEVKERAVVAKEVPVAYCVLAPSLK